MSNPSFPDFYQTLQDFWKNNPSGIPGFGQLVLPPMSIDELDKRIADLKAVETWLTINMNLLHSTIQTMEMQRNAFSTLNQLSTQFDSANPPQVSDKETYADIANLWWKMLQTQFEQITQAATPASHASTHQEDKHHQASHTHKKTTATSPKSKK